MKWNLKNWMRILVSLMFALGVIMTTGCEDAGDDLADDMEEIGDDVSDAVEDAGDEIEDAVD